LASFRCSDRSSPSIKRATRRSNSRRRAKAQPLPLPGELSHEEGLALLDEIADMGAKICVLSGGDPLKRADLLELIRH